MLKAIDWDTKIPSGYSNIKDAIVSVYESPGGSVGDTAAKFGVSFGAMRQKMKALGIPRKPQGLHETRWDLLVAKGCSDIKETIIKLYWDEGRSLQQTAKKIGVCPETLRGKMARIGIELRNPRVIKNNS